MYVCRYICSRNLNIIDAVYFYTTFLKAYPCAWNVYKEQSSLKGTSDEKQVSYFILLAIGQSLVVFFLYFIFCGGGCNQIVTVY